MDAHVRDVRRHMRRRSDRVVIHRLIDVDEANALVRQRSEEFRRKPGQMPDLDDQRILIEGAHDIAKPLSALVGPLETPRKLQQYRAEPFGIHHYVEAGAHLIDFLGCPGSVALVGETLPDFRGEAKIAMILHAFDPGFRRARQWWTVKARVDFDGVEEVRDVAELVELG